MSTAFVLAGGGSLGAVQVGMLKALSRHRVIPDFIVGSSVGAINAACFAAEPDEHGVARLERIWQGLRRRDIFPFAIIRSALCLAGVKDYFAPPGPLQALIESELPYMQLEEARIPCHVVATDILDGSEVVISSGPVVPALLASAAIPAVFPSVIIDGRHLMDGGIASNTPIAAAYALGATKVIVLPTGSPCMLQTPPNGVMAIALHALNLLSMRQLLSDIDRFSNSCELIVVPPLCPLATHTYDFSHTDELIRRAEAATRLWLKSGLSDRNARALTPHHHNGP